MQKLPERAHPALDTSRCGTVLIEVLLSISVIAITMGVTVNTFSTCTRIQSDVKEISIARHLGEMQLLNLRIMAGRLQEGEMSGTFEKPFSDFRWNARIHFSQEGLSSHIVELIVRKRAEPGSLIKLSAPL